jgi:hypothetical protein
MDCSDEMNSMANQASKKENTDKRARDRQRRELRQFSPMMAFAIRLVTIYGLCQMAVWILVALGEMGHRF